MTFLNTDKHNKSQQVRNNPTMSFGDGPENSLTPENLPDGLAMHYKTQFVGLDEEPQQTRCPLCDNDFLLPTDEKPFLAHLFEIHRLVIGDVWKIASLKSYVHYWGVKFKEQPLTAFCTTLLMDCTPDGKPSKDEVYYLLSDCISEDRTLRDELHRTRLESVLSQQERERKDVAFKRGCIFCKNEITGSRSDYLKHLSQKHNIQLGRPENLVFIDKLLDRIQKSIESLTCIYCERIFKDRNVLKEHMRKKWHKRINPNNKTYDMHYAVNYLEPGGQRKQKEQETTEKEELTDNGSDDDDEESSWGDWAGDSGVVTCLFCSTTDNEFDRILRHMKDQHNFDFQSSTKDLNFYEKIKVVNYLRRQTYVKKCIYCEEDAEDVLEHMREKKHAKLPLSEVWNQPEFYFPMYETDSFLYNLESNSDSEDESSNEKNITEGTNF